LKKFAVVTVLLLAAAAVAALWYFGRGPDLSQYESLVNPRMTTLPDQTVLQVTAKGDPNESASGAFGALFETYFSLDDVPKGPGQPAPRARWPAGPEVSPDNWIGLYAIPVPSSVSRLPVVDRDPSAEIELAVWEYGEVAEILHKGPYDTEQAAISRLEKFIADSGYEIVGLHEEEYLRGPGMLLPVSPDDYYTIIRYRVRAAPE
jgi:effector-binding domain-containing protein